MDCCENTKHENKEKTIKMDRRIVMWVIIGILLIATIFLVVKASSIGSGGTEKIDTTGWTENEKMNYDMHGTVPARVGGGSSPGNTQMVGGC